jgi:transposase
MFAEMGEKRRRFTKEFKEEAVKLSARGDLTIRQVAADLGIHEKALHRWRREYRQSHQTGKRFAPGNGHARDAVSAELARLKKENELLRQERDILKKAAAYFAQHTR